MAAILSIQVEQQQIKDLLARLDPKQLSQAAYQIVTRTTRTLRMETSKKVRETLTIKSFGAKEVIGSKMPTKSNPVGTITIRDTNVPAIWYMTERSVSSRLAGKGRSLSIRFRKDKPPLKFPNYFVATVASAAQEAKGVAHTGVFGRSRHLPTKGSSQGKGKLTPSGFAGRLAIKEVLGPDPYSLMIQDGQLTAITQGLMTRAQDRMLEVARGQMYRFTGERIISGAQTVNTEPAGERM